MRRRVLAFEAKRHRIPVLTSATEPSAKARGTRVRRAFEPRERCDELVLGVKHGVDGGEVWSWPAYSGLKRTAHELDVPPRQRSPVSRSQAEMMVLDRCTTQKVLRSQARG
jgi:hypothetical protein